jgi:flagellar motor switch protein FliM
MMYFTSATFNLKKAVQAGVLFTRTFVDPEEVTTFISHVLPLMLCYFIMAVLAITPQTRTLRIALFPAMVVLALRATLSMDMSLKNTERKFHRYLAVSVH